MCSSDLHQTVPIPVNEAARLAELKRYKVLDTLPEPAIDDLSRITAQICGTPAALVSFVDRDRLWFKSKVGYEADEGPRQPSFCAHVVLEPDEIMVVPDATKDPRFVNNPLVTQPNGIRFYAGTPLVTKEGYAIGALCAIDIKPRQLSTAQIDTLAALGRQVIDQLDARLNLDRLESTVQELNKAQASAVQNAKMLALGRLVGGIAHEINNPIGFIGSNLSHVRDNTADLVEAVKLYEQAMPEPPEHVADRLESLDVDYIVCDLPRIVSSMEGGVHRVVKIVESLRTFARSQESAVKKIDLNANIDSVLVLLESQLAETETQGPIDVTRNYGELPPLLCQPSLLNQVFLNIIENATEAIDALTATGNHRPGKIEIATATDGDRVRIEISDNGIGVKPDNADRIFDPFFTTKRLGRGPGLGLSACYAIVTEQHSGTIAYHPRPDGGSRFEITLPIAAPDRETEP